MSNRLRAKKNQIEQKNPTRLLEGQIGYFSGNDFTTPTFEELQQQIRERAYLLWEEDDRPQSDGVDYWVKAEKELFGDKTQEGGYQVFLCDLTKSYNKGKDCHFEPVVIVPAIPAERGEAEVEVAST